MVNAAVMDERTTASIESISITNLLELKNQIPIIYFWMKRT